MNKSELIDAAADASGVSKADVSNALEAILDTIVQSVKSGEKVTLTGFGSFERRERGARTGRNPQTGEEVQIAASKIPAFKAGKVFRDAVNV